MDILNDEGIAERIIDRLALDISDRAGLKHEWYKIDDEVMNGELKPTWKKIILSALTEIGWAKLDPDQKTPDYSHPTKEDRASAHCCQWWDIDWYIAGQSQRESDLKHAGWRKVKEAQDD